jgi:hypothetical protein
MLDTATQWQLYVQALPTSAAPYNQGGIALYANKFYGAAGWPRYSNEWLPGDVVEVTGLLNFYNGKTNLNERHDEDNVFTVTLIEHGSLPDPWLLPSIAACTTFDATRATGGERYQGQWSRLEGVYLSGGTWAAGATVTITDDSGATLPMLLGGLGDFDAWAAPAGQFNVTALFDQEDTDGSPYTNAYRIWPLAYDQIALWGDTDLSGLVDAADYAVTAANLGDGRTDHVWAEGDFDGNGVVNQVDMDALLVNLVPEPGTLALVAAGLGLAAARSRKREGRA